MKKWFKNLKNKTIYRSKLALWEMEFDRLFNLCSDTGGENSPYYEKLQEHLKKRPTDVVD